MKLCYSTLASPTWTLQQTVEGTVAAGLQGIDFRGLGPEIDTTKTTAFNEGLDATLALLRSKGLEMPCLNTSVTLVTPAPERWQMMLEEFQRSAHVAARSGTRYLRIFGGAGPKGMTSDEALALAHRHLRQLVKIAQPFHCQPLLETHDVWGTSPVILSLIHEFNPAEVGIIWDVEHPYRMGEKPMETALAMKRYILHTQFKDGIMQDGKNLPRLMGQGDVPLAESLAALRAIGYDGWICFEGEKRWHMQDVDEPEVTLPQFTRYMREVLGV